MACGPAAECVLGLDNPNHGATSFDNIFFALLAIFQCVTMEGWTHIMIYLQKTFSIWVILYFLPLMFLGAFFFINLTLAVIKMKFTNTMAKLREGKREVKSQPTDVEFPPTASAVRMQL